MIRSIYGEAHGTRLRVYMGLTLLLLSWLVIGFNNMMILYMDTYREQTPSVFEWLSFGVSHVVQFGKLLSLLRWGVSVEWQCVSVILFIFPVISILACWRIKAMQYLMLALLLLMLLIDCVALLRYADLEILGGPRGVDLGLLHMIFGLLSVVPTALGLLISILIVTFEAERPLT